MKAWKKIALGISGLTLMSATLFTVSMAWYQSLNKASISNEQGYTASAYFAGGDGSSANPYIINQPIHLYNLAWLQYLGFFNKNSNGAYKQTYFVLGADVDMSSTTINWTLPPIGTTDNPFIGNFDGKGYTISNLVVDNTLGDGHITRTPTIVTSITGVNIVGTFGVVGPYNLSSSYTYSSAVNSVQNFRLNNTEVKSSLSQCLIGVAAGYVDAAVNNVGLVSSTITVNPSTTALTNGPTTNISDYSTIGYCTDNYKTKRNTSTVSVKAPSVELSKFVAPNTGDASGWGGSIKMNEIYTRLLGYHTTAKNSPWDLSDYVETESVSRTVVDGVVTSETVTSSTNYDSYTASFLQYFDDSTFSETDPDTQETSDYSNALKGKYCFCRYYLNEGWYSSSYVDTDTYLYLYGKKDFNKTITPTITETIKHTDTYTISNGTYYLVESSGSISSTTTATDASAFVVPASGATGTISVLDSGGSTYYLGVSYSSSTVGSLYLTTSSTASGRNSVSWTRSSNDNFSATVTRNRINYTYFLQIRNGSWTARTTSSALTLARKPYTSTTTRTGDSETAVSATTYDTYFPLNVDSNNVATKTNTGYIISGSTYSSSDYCGSSGSGDIRVSKYDIGSISTAIGDSSTYSDNALEVVTRTPTSGGYVRIKDSYNDNTSHTVSSSLSTPFPNKYAYDDTTYMNLKKYSTSRATLSTVLSGSSYIYGLHFMDAAISSTDCCTAEAVRVNNKYLTSYPMPRNSIDFNLQERGYINFFAGTYFSGNNSFFSLHKIERDSLTNAISSIKEISTIYGSTSESDPFIYEYSDGTYSASLPSTGYSEIFDTQWIQNLGTQSSGTSNWVDDAVYYFEIPVNSGEYALGSVSGRTGAYLLYLDISANAQQINRTAVTEYIINTTNVYEYPLGVSINAATTDSVDPLLGAAIALNASYSGSFAVAKSTTVITITSNNNNFTPGFKGDDVTLARSGSTDPPAVVPKSSSSDVIKRLTYIDYNMTTTKTTYTIFTDHNGTMTYTDGDGNAVTKYTTSAGKIVNTSTFGSIDVSGLTTEICSYWYSYSAETSTITATFVFTHVKDDSQASTVHYDKVTGYTVTVKSTSEAVSINVTVKDGNYVITINGTTITVGTVVAVPVTTA